MADAGTLLNEAQTLFTMRPSAISANFDKFDQV